MTRAVRGVHEGPMSHVHLSGLVAHYGYAATFTAILLASAGIPLPAGELLIAAGIYASHTHRLSLPILVLVGSLAAILGSAAGYGVGRSVAAATLSKYGGFIGLGPARIRLGQYLFIVHGGKIVFFLRFVALVGPFGGVLAGTNRMGVGRFMAFNALGGVAWTLVFGVGGYLFGAFFKAVGRPLGIAAVVLAVGLVIGLVIYIHRQGAALQAKADAMLLD
ncbi:MAG TPA: DedA family protein [Caulobacteraceae bacterium]